MKDTSGNAVRSLAVLTLVFALAACGRPEAPESGAGGYDSTDAQQGSGQVIETAPSAGQITETAPSAGHMTETDTHILRGNSIHSEFLSEDMAQRYGIEPASNRGLLNVVILRKTPDGENVAVSASVDAQQQNLIGHIESIELREVEANQHISYVGTFEIGEQGVYRFVIEAQPEDSEATLSLKFEGRFDSAR